MSKLTVAVDSETELIRQNVLAPKPICWSFAYDEHGELHDAEAGLDLLSTLLDDDEVTLVFHASYFDLAVAGVHRPSLLPKIFRAFIQGRIRDTKSRQQLLDIANGRKGAGKDDENEGKYLVWTGEKWEQTDYHLATLIKKYLGKDRSSEKEDPNSPRTRYGEVAGVPICEWPKPFIDYAIADAVDTLSVYRAQGGSIPDERPQVFADFCLHLASITGLTVDRTRVQELEELCTKKLASLKDRLTRIGYYREDGSKDTKFLKARVEKAFKRHGLRLQLTKKGKTKTDRDALVQARAPVLQWMAQNGPYSKVLSTYVPALKHSTVHARFNVLVNNGRPSSWNPNLYNLPRGWVIDGKKLDVRSCIVAPPGYLLMSCDWDCAEFRTWGQICYDLFGWSDVAAFFQDNPDGDPHLELACSVLGISYEEGVKRKAAGDHQVVDMRQGQKPVNFGLPGGMGVATLIESARKSYNVNLTPAEAKRKINQFARRWKEYRPYMAHINRLMAAGPRQIKQAVSGRVRTVHRFADCANTFWSGLLADLSKHAFCLVTREAYTDQSSPLFGTRPVLSLYDEILALVPVDKAHEAAYRVRDIMCDVAPRKYTPDVPMRAAPALAYRWVKGAKPKHDAAGRLVPCDSPV